MSHNPDQINACQPDYQEELIKDLTEKTNELVV